METAKHPYEFKMIRAKEITVDRNYQRSIQKPMVREIVNNFDYHKVNCVKVIYRDGQYFAFDGQQTTNGLRQKFGDNYLVPCLVYYDVPSWVDEAELFEGTNGKKARKSVCSRDLWTSRINRGELVAMEIKRILEKNGFELWIRSNNSGKYWRVQALEAIERAYLKLGAVKFDELVEVIAKSWHGAPESVTSPMLGGMTLFISTYYGEYRKSRLIEKLGNPTSMGKIISGGASGSKTGPKKYALEIATIYNDHMSEKGSGYLDTKKI